MIAIDTHVLVRFLTLDDPKQWPAAEALLAHANGVFVPKTVLLELEWVLRAAYKLSRPTIHGALGKLLGLPNLSVECPDQIVRALDGYARGLDFADALHLAASVTDEGFFTFDAPFAKAASAAGQRVHLAGQVPGGRGTSSERKK